MSEPSNWEKEVKPPDGDEAITNPRTGPPKQLGNLLATLSMTEWIPWENNLTVRVRFWVHDLPLGKNGKIISVTVFYRSNGEHFAKRSKDV